MIPRPLGDQSGQVTILVVGMALVVFSVAGLAIDGTRAFLERRALQNLADAAALAAADQVDRTAFYEGGGEELRLDPEAARRVAVDRLRRAGRAVRAGVLIEDSVVEVSLRSRVGARFLRLVGIDSIPVAAVSRARPEVGSVP